MTIEALIYSILSSNAGVSALVGTRVYPVVLPRSYDPATAGDALTFSAVSGDEEITLDGKRWGEKRIQIDAWSAQYANAKAIQTAVNNALDGAVNAAQGLTLAYQSITMDTYEDAINAYRVMVEYQVCFNTN